jgi:hypothetical protein
MSTLQPSDNALHASWVKNLPLAAQRSLRLLQSLSVGGLRMQLPDQRELVFGSAQAAHNQYSGTPMAGVCSRHALRRYWVC